jgi:hypothetical protein
VGSNARHWLPSVKRSKILLSIDLMGSVVNRAQDEAGAPTDSGILVGQWLALPN